MTTAFADRKVKLDVFRPLRYSDLEDNLQGIIWNILKQDATVTSLCSSILDREPDRLWTGVGFPYVIVTTPTVEEEPSRVGFRSSRKITLTVPVKVWYKTQGDLRRLLSAIRSALESNQADTIANHAYHYRVPRVSANQREMPDGTVLYYHTMFVEYQTVK